MQGTMGKEGSGLMEGGWAQSIHEDSESEEKCEGHHCI